MLQPGLILLRWTRVVHPTGAPGWDLREGPPGGTPEGTPEGPRRDLGGLQEGR